MDGFNPYGNRAAGKIASVGTVFMACLNLPPSLRFRPENVFLFCMIPGPHHPSVSEINHIIAPLVDQMLPFWDRGVYFTRTFSHPKGQLVRCAIVPLVCDLPAARQMSGFASASSSNCCSFCRLRLQNIDELDMSLWGARRTRAEYTALAEAYRDGSAATQFAIFEEHGIRWSELLRLPYWDPTRHVILDTMHALLLNGLGTHCRKIWGMNVKLDSGDGIRDYQKQYKTASEKDMTQGWHVLRYGSDKELSSLKLRVLRTMCMELQLRPGGRQGALLTELHKFVSNVFLIRFRH